MSNFFLTKEQKKNLNGEGTAFSINGAGAIGHPWGKCESQPKFTFHTNIISKSRSWI